MRIPTHAWLVWLLMAAVPGCLLPESDLPTTADAAAIRMDAAQLHPVVKDAGRNMDASPVLDAATDAAPIYDASPRIDAAPDRDAAPDDDAGPPVHIDPCTTLGVQETPEELDGGTDWRVKSGAGFCIAPGAAVSCGTSDSLIDTFTLCNLPLGTAANSDFEVYVIAWNEDGSGAAHANVNGRGALAGPVLGELTPIDAMSYRVTATSPWWLRIRSASGVARAQQGTCSVELLPPSEARPTHTANVTLCLTNPEPDPGAEQVDPNEPAFEVPEHDLAEWPMPDAQTGARVAPSYTVAGRTVIDDVTLLNWQRELPATYPGCTGMTDGGTAGDSCTWEEAVAYCGNLSQTMGSLGWRLPTRIELLSIWDHTLPNPHIDGAAFPATPEGSYWTSSPWRGSAVSSWFVSFGRGLPEWGHESAHRVRCVRSPNPTPTLPVTHYQALEAGTIKDNYTGLTWLSKLERTRRTWTEATAYCTNLALDGGGWRMPTIKELMTLVDVSRWPVQLDPIFDRTWVDATDRTDSFASDLWSSSLTSPLVESSLPWTVDFELGGLASALQTNSLRTICVR